MADPYLLLGDIYESGGMRAEAAGVYREAAGNENLSPRDRSVFERKSLLMRR
jgi:hypothetical protein